MAGNAPAWLFAFVDLAFLLLLGMPQLGVGERAIDLGEVVVPRIGEATAEAPPRGAEELAQLRVHPREAADDAPFELVRADDRSWVDAPELIAHLEAWRADGAKRPLLAPHDQSLSRDLLSAVAAVETVWPSRRRAAIERIASPSP